MLWLARVFFVFVWLEDSTPGFELDCYAAALCCLFVDYDSRAYLSSEKIERLQEKCLTLGINFHALKM